MKIRPAGAELFHADERTDGQTDMKMLIVVFRNFARTRLRTEFRMPKSRYDDITVQAFQWHATTTTHSRKLSCQNTFACKPTYLQATMQNSTETS